MLIARAYTSPTLVLLAFDYPEGKGQADFLGFAIKREPGFAGSASSYLPNRIGFGGPDASGKSQGSDRWPIQKFYWWDAQINSDDRGKSFTYTVQVVRGTPDSLTFDPDAKTLRVPIPEQVENGIGSFFNRAVVSSQSFVQRFGHNPTGQLLHGAYVWLANGMEQVVGDFLARAQSDGLGIEGAIYHLSQTDEGEFIIPSMAAFRNAESLVYHANDDVDRPAIRQLKPAGVDFSARTKTHIMHDKFLVATQGKEARRLVMGSANYTTEGLTQQANLMHTWESPDLAQLYLDRKKQLESDPSIATIAKSAAWSDAIVCGDATVRVFFPPEPRLKNKKEGDSIQTIIDAVKGATASAVFCLFSPTDLELLEALFSVGDAGKMLFGLVNTVPESEPKPNKKGVTDPVKVTIYDRNSKGSQLEIGGHEAFRKGDTPQGFSWEDSAVGSGGQFPVYIHHKFIVIDGETENPTIYSGSANMSANSMFYNDENLLEITRSPRMGQIYLAEFMRLFEHYRARLAYNMRQLGKSDTFTLTPNNRWAKDWYGPGPKANSRAAMAAPLGSTGRGST